MGKLEVRGNASKTVDYDLMKIELDFHAKKPANKSQEPFQQVFIFHMLRFLCTTKRPE